MLLRPTRIRAKFVRFYISVSRYVKNAPHFTLSNKDIPKSCPILDPNLWRGTFGGVCFCAPTRVRAKFDGFHISAHDMTRNLPDFRPKPSARNIWGRMQYAPTRVRAKFGGFHIPANDMVQNPAGFRPKPSARDFSGRMQYAPTRVHPKFGGFHISAHGCAKNTPDFTLPNKDTPKTRPILGPNLRRGLFRGVCNTPLHGYMKNPAGFIFPHTI